MTRPALLVALAVAIWIPLAYVAGSSDRGRDDVVTVTIPRTGEEIRVRAPRPDRPLTLHARGGTYRVDSTGGIVRVTSREARE